VISTDIVPQTRSAADSPARPARRVGSVIRRAVAGSATLLWAVIVIVPVYWVVVTSLRGRTGFLTSDPLSLPAPLTWSNYATVIDGGFVTYLANSVVVTFAAAALTIMASFMAAFLIVRRASRWTLLYFRMFLLGLAIPMQAVIIPVYLLIIRMHLYDSLVAIILPSAAFSVPVTVMILVSFLRDVPGSLFEAMVLDGAGEWRTLVSLALPLARPALMTVAVYDTLQVWNGFLFPLILTQSADKAVLPLALMNYQGQYGINVPATMAAVVLSTVPMAAVYILARRQLIAGLTAGFSK
jgi:raffinose/stachyose/melibiose transport system permease protein